MLKNFSDFASLFTLLLATFMSLLSFIKSFVSHKQDVILTTRYEYLKNYLDNEDE